ncbi:hypothetical protein KI372_07015 [Halobacterium salinarum]|uniref:hypothetical protein n=1 Tax=Halobacterium salinarum TaxID=2242 RepID=UPI001F32D641|nr:hypothetical protein [Halobacterium salinarum]MCF2206488.1 hypothetical protein [Halobacterium salinarum]MCF2241129.1 hypothetical protein [Halobacterium salinarum]
MDEGLRLRYVLDNAIERAYTGIDRPPAILNEILPVLGQEVYDGDGVGDLYESYLIETSIARIRKEAIDLDNRLQDYFYSIPDSTVESLYKLDLDDSRYSIGREEWDFVKRYCRSFLLTDRLIPLFNMCNELFKVRTAELMSRKVFTDGYGGETGENWLLENEPIQHSQRPELLMRCGVIDSDLKRDIEDVSNYRHDLIHELGKWGDLEPPERILSNLETAVATIESLDEKLDYPSQVRLHHEQNRHDVLDFLDEERVRERLSEEASVDLETARDVVEEEMFRSAFTGEAESFHENLKEGLSDEDSQIETFERFWRNELSKADEEEFRPLLLYWAGAINTHLDINIFRTLRANRDRFEGKVPAEFMTEEFVEEFDSFEIETELE